MGNIPLSAIKRVKKINQGIVFTLFYLLLCINKLWFWISSDKKKAQNWFQRQFLGKMSHDYDSLEIEHATALAAAVFAISLREFPEQKINDGPESSFTKTKGKIGSKISLSSQPSSLSKRLSGKDMIRKTMEFENMNFIMMVNCIFFICRFI